MRKMATIGSDAARRRKRAEGPVKGPLPRIREGIEAPKPPPASQGAAPSSDNYISREEAKARAKFDDSY